MSQNNAVRCCVLDPICFRPYDNLSLLNEGLPGTEATVVHLAEILDWDVYQHNRLVSSGRYLPMPADFEASVIIVLRNPRLAVECARKHPNSRVVLWFHDLHPLGSSRAKELSRELASIGDLGVLMVAVSDFLKKQLEAVIDNTGISGLSVTRIYNPVVVPEFPPLPVDEDKLIFFSSPHKGLETAVKVFAGLRRKFRNLRLLIANPGYMAAPCIHGDRIEFLGQQPHSSLLAHVKTSLCTLLPNYVYPETFGLVLAESNALGTPVLTHDIGAAGEILSDENQLIPIPRGRMRLDGIQKKLPYAEEVLESAYARLGGYDGFIDRVAAWRTGARPNVSLRREFSLEQISLEWRNFVASHHSEVVGSQRLGQ